MIKTMTLAAAARWAGVSPRMLGLMLTGRLIDSLSELEVDCTGLAPELVSSMPGRATGCDGERSGGHAERHSRRHSSPRQRTVLPSRGATEWGAVPPTQPVDGSGLMRR